MGSRTTPVLDDGVLHNYCLQWNSVWASNWNGRPYLGHFTPYSLQIWDAAHLHCTVTNGLFLS